MNTTKTFFFTTFFMFFISCNSNSNHFVIISSQGYEGKGDIIEKTNSDNFNGIEISNSITVDVYRSNQNKIVVLAPSDIINNINIAKDENNKMHINMKGGFKAISTKKIMVKIYAKTLDYIEANSSSKINLIDEINEKFVTIVAKESGYIRGNINSTQLNVRTKSSGGFEGNISTKYLLLETSSSGYILASGTAFETEANAYSSGSIHAEKLLVQISKTNASSSGSINIRTKMEAFANASSSGYISIIKEGTPQIQISESSGGKINVK